MIYMYIIDQIDHNTYYIHDTHQRSHSSAFVPELFIEVCEDLWRGQKK